VDRIGELLHSKEKRETVGARARAHASERSWRNATHELLAYYQDAIEMQRVGRLKETNPDSLGLRARTRKVMRRAIIFAVRKMFP
jgi:hypothetical protein